MEKCAVLVILDLAVSLILLIQFLRINKLKLKTWGKISNTIHKASKMKLYREEIIPTFKISLRRLERKVQKLGGETE